LQILIVDDEAIIRTGLKGIISRVRNNSDVIKIAQNGVDALKLIKNWSPDIVITDIKMPEMNGIELACKIDEINAKCKHGSNIKCVILSGYSEFEYAQKAMKYGVSEYILKPIREEQIKDVIFNIEEEIREEYKKNLYHDLYFTKGLPALKEKAIRDLLFYSLDDGMKYRTTFVESGITFNHKATAL
jgi:two-component system, response regulator YesN